jgi:hypothetical protein
MSSDSENMSSKNEESKNEESKNEGPKSVDLMHLTNYSIANEKPMTVFSPDCIRKKSNWSTIKNEFKMDHPDFNPPIFLKDMPNFSPKLVALLQKINQLDARDQQKYGKTFKHFIFSDIKAGGQGAKMLASGLISSGWNLAYKSELKNRNKFQQPQSAKIEPDWGPLELLTQAELLTTRKNNFYLLSSVPVFEKPISVRMKKDILATFNSRPENIYGDLARIIVMDSGFKEGIDLFDIKYVHIFEPSINLADQKQVIGRGTRTCGQKGLEFHPTQGWPLEVFIYDLEIPEKMRFSLLGADTAHNLLIRAMNADVRLANFGYDVERLAVVGSVDYDLNQNVHNFKVDLLDEDADEIVFGGASSSSKSLNLSIDSFDSKMFNSRSSTPLNSPSLNSPSLTQLNSPSTFGYKKMKKYIEDNFSQFSWENVIMENQCGEIPKEWKDWSWDKSKSLSKSDNKSSSFETIPLSDSPIMDSPIMDSPIMDSPIMDSTKFETVQLTKLNGGAAALKFTPTQAFVQGYFTPDAPVKGMLLYHSVGTGKTCSAIAAATTNFEPLGYTILWVTRTTLKNDIWKNMFDQVCHKSIQTKIENGLSMPDAQKDRMRLLSKAWRFRPMSYKQFSNLVSKKNRLYTELVKQNGEADPLQKTLIIIDEAHKLYGGGDLSSLERPDMKALHESLMNSYAISGANSVRLLLMTATPITENPMELVQLMNLCKPIHEQMPASFDLFASQYLSEEGVFTKKGQRQFMDNIAGHISYLNREKDARQFSQPRVRKIMVPMLSNELLKYVDDFDKFILRSESENEVLKMQERLESVATKIEDELRIISKNDFDFLYDHCAKFPEIPQKKCETVIRKNVVSLMKEVSGYIKTFKEQLKTIRSEISKMKKGKQEKLYIIKNKIRDNPLLFSQYKESTYASLRDQCSSRTLKGTQFLEAVQNLPDVVLIDGQIRECKELIQMLQTQSVSEVKMFNLKIKQMKEMLKRSDIPAVQKTAIEHSIRDNQRSFKVTKKEKTEKFTNQIDDVKKKLKETEKKKKTYFAAVRKTLKQKDKKRRKEEKTAKKDANKLKKTAKKQEELVEEIQEIEIKEMAERRKELIERDLQDLGEKERQKMQKKEEIMHIKNVAKTLKQREKQEEKERKQLEKDVEKERKMLEKDEEKERKKLEKQKGK